MSGLNRDDIIRMAVEAGFLTNELGSYLISPYNDEFDVHLDHLEKFAELVAAAEREACAKVCASFDLAPSKPTSYTIRKQVEAIRARGQKCN